MRNSKLPSADINSSDLKILPFLKKIFLKCWRIVLYFLVFFLAIYLTLGVFSATVLLICLVLYHLLFHPDHNQKARAFVQLPSSVGLPYQNLFIKSLDGTLIHMYLIKQPEPQGSIAPTIVYFHGNAGNMGHRLQNAGELYLNLQCNILMVEYRGYGLSKGHATEKGIYMDAQAALDFLASRPDINQNKIIIFGRSLGGAVAIDLVSRPEYSCRIWCVIVENTFTSIPDITLALFKYAWLKYFPTIFYKNQFLSKSKVDSIRVPILFISGLNDTLVPPWMMSELHLACSSQFKVLSQFPRGGHNDTWTCAKYYSSIVEFIKSAHAYEPAPPASSVVDI